MCGRCVYTLTKSRFAHVANVNDVQEISPCYNAGPTFKLPVMYTRGGVRAVRGMKWGLKPRFKSDVHLTTSNARSEGIEHSKLYSPSLNKQRCVLIIDAFYEWNNKRPFLIRFADHLKQRPIPDGTTRNQSDPECESKALSKGEKEFLPEGVSPLMLGGLYDERDGEFSFTVVTIEAAGLVAEIHERMPLLLTSEDSAEWLDECRSYKEIADRLIMRSAETAKELHSLRGVRKCEFHQEPTSRLRAGGKKDHEDKQFSKGLGRFFTWLLLAKNLICQSRFCCVDSDRGVSVVEDIQCREFRVGLSGLVLRLRLCKLGSVYVLDVFYTPVVFRNLRVDTSRSTAQTRAEFKGSSIKA